MSYQATVASIRTRPHPNADRLQLGVVCNSTVIVGLDTKDGDLGVFFPADGQLSYEFAKANKLLKEDGGYLEESRRVKALKLRGIKSDGLWLPIECLAATHDATCVPREGDIIDDARICNKYETPATIRARRGREGQAAKASVYFPKHAETDQFRTAGGLIPAGSLITLTEKLHGTSGRYGLVPSDAPRPLWERLLKKLKLHRDIHWEFLVGSRNVVLSKHPEMGYYGSEKFRTDVVGSLPFHLRVGEVVFGEIVGFTDGGQPIMPPNKGVPYAYGQQPGTAKFYVYNIVQYMESGDLLTLPYHAMVTRAKQLGFATPTLFEQFVYTGDAKDLAQRVEWYVSGLSTLDASHIREGVVVRVDTPYGNTYWLKDKSFDFKLAEGIVKDNPDIVDMEEAS